jgi:hypothetical protein
VSIARIPTLLVLVLALVGLTACGVPTQESAKKVDNKDVPFKLLDKASGVTTSDTAGDDVAVYLATADRLVPVSRRLSPPITLEKLLVALSKGPTSAEVAAGLRSALPTESAIRSVAVG